MRVALSYDQFIQSATAVADELARTQCAPLAERDLRGNIDKLRRYRAEHPHTPFSEWVDLKRMSMDSENPRCWLQWMCWTFSFIVEFKRRWSAEKAYDATLAHHHTWYVRMLARRSFTVLEPTAIHWTRIYQHARAAHAIAEYLLQVPDTPR